MNLNDIFIFFALIHRRNDSLTVVVLILFRIPYVIQDFAWTAMPEY